MSSHRVVIAGILSSFLAACGGPGVDHEGPSPDPAHPTPDDGVLAVAEAEALFNDAVGLALAGAPGVTITRTPQSVRLDGTVVLGAGDVSFDALVLAKKPFSPSGAAAVASEDHLASLSFTGSVTGTATIDGAPAGSVTADFPMTAEFAEAAADWALHAVLLSGSSFQSPCPNLTVTDNGDGSFTLDGDCAAGGATIDFDMVTVDLVNLTIEGTITLDDGNNNTAVIDFDGDTFDLTVNGTLVLDDEPVFL